MALDTNSLTRLSISLYDACYDADAWPLAAQALRGCLDSMAATLVVRRDADFQTVHSEAALRRHVGLTTVRSQLASLFRKTGTTRQGQLIALLARAMAP